MFLATYFPNPSCVPNLKLLALKITKISRGQIFLDAPLAEIPANFGLKVVFGIATPQTQVVYQIGSC